MLGTKIPDPMPEKKALPRELILNGIFFDNKVKVHELASMSVH